MATLKDNGNFERRPHRDDALRQNIGTLIARVTRADFDTAQKLASEILAIVRLSDSIADELGPTEPGP